MIHPATAKCMRSVTTAFGDRLRHRQPIQNKVLQHFEDFPDVAFSVRLIAVDPVQAPKDQGVDCR